MPPLVPRKRDSSSSPILHNARVTIHNPPKGKARSTNASLFHAADAQRSVPSSEQNRQLLQQLDGDDDSSLSDVSSAELDSEALEPPAKRRKVQAPSRDDKTEVRASPGSDTSSGDEDEEDEEEDANHWDDFIATHEQNQPSSADKASAAERIQVTLENAPQDVDIGIHFDEGKKKGPSKIERQIRTSTHCMHVQCLMAHNAIRNRWICNKNVQKVLVDSLPSACKDEVKKWKKACGNALPWDEEQETASETRRKGGKNSKKAKSQRDWGPKADAPDTSHGDPIWRLMKSLCAYWRKRFTITAPGLRKQGYKTIRRLEDEMKGLKNDPDDFEEFGERIAHVKDFANRAKDCEGSRDAGAQLFTALLRGLGLEARMVASLQPIGFGWSKAEEADPPKPKKKRQNPQPASTDARQTSNSGPGNTVASRPSKPPATRKPKPRVGGAKEQPIDLSDDESELSSLPPSEDDSVIDITPARKPILSRKKFDLDLHFPHYWTEVLSPITNTWIPVDPIVLNVVTSSAEAANVFEPRGAAADRTKQVLAYVVAFNKDGSAKDVTTRYLKKHMWPGKTKGLRMPVEKVPIYNRKGKVLKTEEYDWFKHLMTYYARTTSARTAADDIEDTQELVPVRIKREGAKAAGEETLQGYKQSAEFVLKCHLRREEAILPHAEQVKTFTYGKGEKAKTEPVYRRADIVSCKSVESWHKEGRELKPGEQPLKYVPMRAVTTIRKREIEEQERETGEKAKQGLYSRDQTDWIIPPPIVNGKIPRNAFGNIDVYVPTMVPEGAVHVPRRGTAKICRKLDIDYAEACTGFEFGNRMAVPILTGVVIAKENKALLLDAWRAEEEQRIKREKAKQEKLALGMWKKLMAGLRVVERVRKEYGDDAEAHIDEAIRSNAKPDKKGKKQQRRSQVKGTPDDSDLDQANEDVSGFDMSGGFFRPGDEPDIAGNITEANADKESSAMEKGYHHEEGGGFIIEDETGEANLPATHATAIPRTPASLVSLRKMAGASSTPLSEGLDDNTNEGANKRNAVPPSKSSSKALLESEDGVNAPRSTASTRRTKRTKQLPSPSSDEEAGDSEPVPAKKRRQSSRVPARDEGQRSKYFEDDGSSAAADNDQEDDDDNDEEEEQGTPAKRTQSARKPAGRPKRGRKVQVASE